MRHKKVFATTFVIVALLCSLWALWNHNWFFQWTIEAEPPTYQTMNLTPLQTAITIILAILGTTIVSLIIAGVFWGIAEANS